jgi:predicted dehydrogenase
MIERALFVGLGGIGQRHLRNLRALLGESVRVSAYRVRREPVLLTDELTTVPGGDVESAYGVEVHTSLESALAEKPDIAVVANPTSLHVPIALAALEAGCDVLVEKPLSDTNAGVDALTTRARELRRVGMVAYQLRFHPCVKGLIELAESEALGLLYGAHVEVAEYLPAFHPYEDYRRMYASRRDLGGGVTLTQIHEIDLVHRIFGLPERVWSVGDRISELEVDVEDSASSLLEYGRKNGRPFAVQLHQDFLGRPPRRTFSIWGSLGRAVMDLRSGTLDFVSTDGSTARLVECSDYPRNQLFLDELAHFLDCVRTRSDPCVPLEEGAAGLRIALALRAAQESGRLVPLDAGVTSG